MRKFKQDVLKKFIRSILDSDKTQEDKVQRLIIAFEFCSRSQLE